MTTGLSRSLHSYTAATAASVTALAQRLDQEMLMHSEKQVQGIAAVSSQGGEEGVSRQ